MATDKTQVQDLVAATKLAYDKFVTRTTSERIRRQLLSVASTNVERVEYDNLPSDVPIGGIAVPLDEPLDEPTVSYFTEAANFIASQADLLYEGNPFTDDF
ncbi:hypothetical protein BDR04DRAFT_1233985 [Suillus decipiens]|nr:hypothetical protein BDR04DRAFT_1233985 [Suillus decipiens]